jgi:hypothetical protein
VLIVDEGCKVAADVVVDNEVLTRDIGVGVMLMLRVVIAIVIVIS